jgi:iron complex outermembrane recepter protein
LKGPQGTLFGRNTTGGAILLTPQEPTDSFEGYLEGSLGNYDAKRIQAVVNVPLAETFRVRLGVDSNKRDGHLDNISDIGTSKLGDSNYTATRLGMLWDVVEGVENYTLLQYVDSDTKGYSATVFACNPTALLGLFSGASALCAAQLERQRVNGDDDFYDVASVVPTPESTIKEKRLINTTSWEVTDDVTIKNIFGYAHLETTSGSNVFGADWPSSNPAFPGYQFSPGASVMNDVPVTSQESYVEEVQIQGSSMDEHLDWQVGIYYEHSRPDGYSGNNGASFLFCDLATVEGNIDGFQCYDPLSGQLGSVLVQHYKTDFLNQAVYGQATYDFSDEFSVTAGLRYTKDQAEGHGIKDRYTFGPTGANVAHYHSVSDPKVESEKPTGMVDFTYRPVEDVMTYFKYTRGYRQGSVNLASDPGLDKHDPEYIDTYELGAKTSFGGPVPGQFNIAAFDNELEDMQLQFGFLSPTSGPTTAITNAGKATVKGVEMDLVLKLLDDLTFSVSYAHLSTELKERGQLSPEVVRQSVLASTNGDAVAAALAASNVAPAADVGDELPYAAKNTWVATLNYLLPVPADMGLMSVGATWSYLGEMRAASTSSTPYDMLPSVELLNLNASWMSIYNSDFDMSLYATNVLDEEYVAYVGGTYNNIGMESRQNGLPKMYGMRVRYSFGG